jgi:diguanylate cyclase (GGDEF)-like protein/PAS domain S-box-containing protein
VTDRYVMTQALAASEERYRLLAHNSSDVVAHVRQGLIVWVSPSLTRALGWQPDEWVQRPFTSFVHPDDIEHGRSHLAVASEGQGAVLRLRLRTKDETFHWVDSHAEPFVNSHGALDGVAASFRVVDDAVAADLELERRATVDDLTGLVRREALFARLTDVRQPHRERDDMAAIVFCDIDHFKAINDAWGHAVGDEVLRTCANRLRSAVRSHDVVARVGGDEFVVILDGVRGIESATKVAEKMRVSVKKPMDVTGGQITATLSLGVTLVAPDDNERMMISRADEAMYRAKAAGRDCVVAALPPAMEARE